MSTTRDANPWSLVRPSGSVAFEACAGYGSGAGLIATAAVGANYGALAAGANVAVDAAILDEEVTAGDFGVAMGIGAILGATQVKVLPTSGSGAIDDIAATAVNKTSNQLLDAATPQIAGLGAEAVGEVADALDTATSLPYIKPACNPSGNASGSTTNC